MRRGAAQKTVRAWMASWRAERFSFTGELDELMIFERALTQAQIQALIAYLKGGTP